MIDLQAIAYQTDMTRVITFMLGARAAIALTVRSGFRTDTIPSPIT